MRRNYEISRSQEVTSLRKSGMLDEAYAKALENIALPDADEWDQRAYGWCLHFLIKRHAEDQDKGKLREYIERFAKFVVPGVDEILSKSRTAALALIDDRRRPVEAAKKLSKAGEHEQAVRAFEPLWVNGILTSDDKISFGWDLFRTISTIMKSAAGKELSQADINTIKQRLNTYLKLGISSPSLLHSCILQQADRLAHLEKLNLVAFAKIWNLENLRPEDYEKDQKDDKVFPSLAEKVIQHVSKEAAAGERVEEMRYILPFANSAMKRFPDNVWLKLNVVKLLRGLHRYDEARLLAVEFARSKATEYWTWEMLGDLETDPTMRLSCYAKALSCSEDDDFVSKVRLKLAALLADVQPGQAKAEVEHVIAVKQQKGEKIPSEAQKLAQTGWFADTTSIATGKPFYNRFKTQAEEILFAHLPWVDASIGDEFIIKGQDGQKDRARRRLYVRAKPIAMEITVSANHPEVRGKPIGAPIKVRMETPHDEPWRTMVHSIQPRDANGQDDLIPEMCGIIDHINKEKSLLHFVVAKGVDGTLQLSDYRGTPALGTTIAVRLVSYQTAKGSRTRVISAAPTDRTPESSACHQFEDTIEISDRGFGFTENGIFVAPDLVASAGLADGDEVAGIAVINYDKKKSTWGWKAIKIQST